MSTEHDETYAPADSAIQPKTKLNWLDRIKKAADDEKAEKVRKQAALETPENLLKRQTIAAELSAVSTFFFTAALVIVGALQWWTSSRYTRLSYALANPKFDITTSSSSSDPKHDYLTTPQDSVHIRPTSGVYAMSTVQLEQEVDLFISDKNHSYTCSLLIDNYFSSDQSFADPHVSDEAYKLNDTANRTWRLDPKYRFNGRILTVAQQSIITVSYYDIFKEPQTAYLMWNRGTAIPISSASELAQGRSKTSIQVQRDGRLALQWKDGNPQNPECRAAGEALTRMSIPDTVRYIQHKSVELKKNPDGSTDKITTTWRTPKFVKARPTSEH